MNTTHTTTRATITVRGNSQFEPLPDYGWRCGFYSLRPELARHAAHPEFIAGLRRGRAQRKSNSIPRATQLILGLPELVEQRRRIQSEYVDAAYRARLVAAQLRAAERNTGRMSSAGRDIGAVQRERAERDGAEVWDEHRRLSDAYAAEVNRLCRLRGMAPYITGGGGA